MAVLSIGDLVTISGLQAKPELNGCVATVVTDDGGERVAVRVDGRHGNTLALRRNNLAITSPPNVCGTIVGCRITSGPRSDAEQRTTVTRSWSRAVWRRPKGQQPAATVTAAAPSPAAKVVAKPWRASPEAQRAAVTALAAALEDARLDTYTPPGLPTAELRQAEGAAAKRSEMICRAAADPSGREVAKELGELDEADCRLSGAALQQRISRKLRFKELAFARLRHGGPQALGEAHKCFCAAARHCDSHRGLYARWVQAHLDAGDRAMADAVAALSERRGAFEFADQRPASLFAPGLVLPSGARGPWFEAADIPAARVLLGAWDTIKREYAALGSKKTVRAGGTGSGKAGSGAAAAFEKYPSPAVACGEWSDVMLVHGGKRHAPHCAKCPDLARLLTDPDSPLRREAAAMVLGSCFFSRMRPGTHLRTHCGPTNLRLRVHIGVDVPRGSGRWRLRVGDEVREWAEGEALIFDDSYEHEVWHEPASPAEEGGGGGAAAASGGETPAAERSRVVLIVDIWHPAIPPHKRAQLLGGHDEATRYERIVKGREPVEPMGERELSDGSVRLVRGD